MDGHAWAGDGTDESRTNPVVAFGALFEGASTPYGPIAAALAALDFAASGTLPVPDGFVGGVYAVALTGQWGDGYDGGSVDDANVSVYLPGECGVVTVPPRLVFFPAPFTTCFGTSMAVGFQLNSLPGGTDAERTNTQILVTVTGPGAYVEPKIVALVPGNGFAAYVGLVVPGDAVGEVTVTATALADWGDGQPAGGETVTTSATLDGNGPCQQAVRDHRARLTTSVQCTSDGYRIDWTVTAWDGPTATEAGRSHPAVTVGVGNLGAGGLPPFEIGEFTPANGFTFSGSSTVPGDSVGQHFVVVDTATGGPWGDGVTTPPDSTGTSNYDGFAILELAGGCVAPTAAPSAVIAAGGDGTATVTWAAPALAPTAYPVTGYVATAAPGGATCTTTGDATCTIDGLTNGDTYTVEVVAHTAPGPSPASVPSDPVTPTAPPSAVVSTAAGQSTVTNASTIRFRVAFDQEVDGFDTGDLEVQGAATVAVASAAFGASAVALAAGDPSAYAVEVTGMAGDGDVSVRVRDGAVLNPNGQTNAASSWFGVTYDATAPSLVLPGSVTVAAAPGAGGAAATWTVSAAGAASVTCSHEAGSTFPVGTTTVTCQAVDVAGNVTSGSFAVVVTAAAAPTPPPTSAGPGPTVPGPPDPGSTPPGAPTTVAELPATGSDQSGLLVAAMTALAVGLALLAATRRRARR